PALREGPAPFVVRPAVRDGPGVRAVPRPPTTPSTSPSARTAAPRTTRANAAPGKESAHATRATVQARDPPGGTVPPRQDPAARRKTRGKPANRHAPVRARTRAPAARKATPPRPGADPARRATPARPGAGPARRVTPPRPGAVPRRAAGLVPRVTPALLRGAGPVARATPARPGVALLKGLVRRPMPVRPGGVRRRGTGPARRVTPVRPVDGTRGGRRTRSGDARPTPPGGRRRIGYGVTPGAVTTGPGAVRPMVPYGGPGARGRARVAVGAPAPARARGAARRTGRGPARAAGDASRLRRGRRWCSASATPGGASASA